MPPKRKRKDDEGGAGSGSAGVTAGAGAGATPMKDDDAKNEKTPLSKEERHRAAFEAYRRDQQAKAAEQANALLGVDIEKADSTTHQPPLTRPTREIDVFERQKADDASRDFQANQYRQQMEANKIPRQPDVKDEQYKQLMNQLFDSTLMAYDQRMVVASYIEKVEMKLDAEEPMEFHSQGVFDWTGTVRVMGFTKSPDGTTEIKMYSLNHGQLSLVNIKTFANGENEVVVKYKAPKYPWPSIRSRDFIGSNGETRGVRFTNDDSAQLMIVGTDGSVLSDYIPQPASMSDIGFNHDGSLLYVKYPNEQIVIYTMKGDIASVVELDQKDESEIGTYGFVHGTSNLIVNGNTRIKTSKPNVQMVDFRIWQYDTSAQGFAKRLNQYYTISPQSRLDGFSYVYYPIKHGIWLLVTLDEEYSGNPKVVLFFMEYPPDDSVSRDLIMHRYDIGKGDGDGTTASLLPDGSICVLFFADRDETNFVLHVVHPHARLYTMSHPRFTGPRAFNKCMGSRGHRVYTIHPGGHKNLYMPVCSSNGHSAHGEVHHKKGK